MNTYILYRLVCSPGVIIATTYDNPTCDSSSILNVITINENECTKYADTTVPFNGSPQPIVIFATYGKYLILIPFIYYIIYSINICVLYFKDHVKEENQQWRHH